jgi:hypothetical protein
VAWVETQSASFTARHESASGAAAREVLDALERFRADLVRTFPDTPGEVAVVIHPQYAQLAVSQPMLPVAQLLAAPASRRYFGGWFAKGEIHVLEPEALQRRASAVPGSQEALRLTPAHEYVHLVVGRNNVDLPPPFTPRTLRDYVRWIWLCEGAAAYFSGQHRHLGAAIGRRLREGSPPAMPPSVRDGALLGGAVFGLLERIAGRAACVELARAPLDGGRGRALLERAFGQPLAEVADAWRDHLEEQASAGREVMEPERR